MNRYEEMSERLRLEAESRYSEPWTSWLWEAADMMISLGNVVNALVDPIEGPLRGDDEDRRRRMLPVPGWKQVHDALDALRKPYVGDYQVYAADRLRSQNQRLRSENELLKNALARSQAEHLADVEPYHYEFLQGATEWLLLDMYGVITMRGPL